MTMSSLLGDHSYQRKTVEELKAKLNKALDELAELETEILSAMQSMDLQSCYYCGSLVEIVEGRLVVRSVPDAYSLNIPSREEMDSAKDFQVVS